MNAPGLIPVRSLRIAALPVALLVACAGPQPTPPPVAQPQPAAPAAQPQPVPAQPPANAPAAQNPLAKRFALENRLDVALLRPVADMTQSAEVAVMLQGGTETSRPGSVELATHLLVHSADATTGRQSLARQIEQMGGVLTVDVGRKSVWIHVRSPAAAWQRAAQAIATSLDAKNAPRSQVERSQQDLVAQQSLATKRAPVRVAT